MHSDDLASACLFLMQNYSEPGIINIGTGEDISIHDLALLIGEISGFQGELVFDSSKPDGTPRKLLDVAKIQDLGWHHSISLKDGIKTTYKWIKGQTESKSSRTVEQISEAPRLAS